MPAPLEIWASPEPTVARVDRTTYRDQLAETGHEVRDGDIDLLASLGISATRYPVLWEKTAPGDPRDADFSWAERRLGALRTRGVEPIVTLLHHGSGPAETSLLDPQFPEKFAAYAGVVAAAFPWVRRWTPINEPLTTARFSTLYGVWYPNRIDDDEAFGHALVNEALAMLLGMEAIGAHVSGAAFVITEDLQGITALEPSVNEFAAHLRLRMSLSIELVMGRVDGGHELYPYLTERCGVAPARLQRVRQHARAPDLVGWNYYPNSDRVLWRNEQGRIDNEAAQLRGPISPLPVLRAVHERLGLPFGISEVHADGSETERVAWLAARHHDLGVLSGEGLPVRMLGAWGAFGLADWNSLLTRRENYREDGIFTFAGPLETPRETAVSAVLRRLAAGRSTGELRRGVQR